MTAVRLVVLDSGALTRLTASTPHLRSLHQSKASFLVPATVLTESLTGDHRRDVQTNRLLRRCEIVAVDEGVARAAARLRTVATGHRASAVDATVIAVAAELPGCLVLTADLGDLGPLAAAADPPVSIAGV